MYRVLCHVLIGACVFAAGCRYRDPSVELLEGELRWMEDQVYMLEDELEHKCSQLDSCHQSTDICGSCDAPPASVITDTPEIISESAPPRVRTQKGPKYDVLPSPEPTESSDEIEMPAPRVELPPATQSRSRVPAYEAIPEGDSSLEPMKLVPPSKESRSEPTLAEPEPAAELVPRASDESNNAKDKASDTADEMVPLLPPPAKLPEPTRSNPGDSGPKGLPPEIDSQSGQREEPARLKIGLSSYASPLPLAHAARGEDFQEDGGNVRGANIDTMVDANVTHVVASAWINTGAPFVDMESDADLFAVIEPRNQDGLPILLGGTMSIVVLDGNQTGDAARVGRWDFDPAAARRSIKVSERGSGMHLELRWPSTPPARTDKLHLFVRYTTVENKDLEFDAPVALTPPKVANQLRPRARGAEAAEGIARQASDEASKDESVGVTSAWRALRSTTERASYEDKDEEIEREDRPARNSIPLSRIPNAVGGLEPTPAAAEPSWAPEREMQEE